MIQRSKLGLNFFPRRFRCHVYLQDLSVVVMRDILQSRYLRRRVAHKQLARTSLSCPPETLVSMTQYSMTLITRKRASASREELLVLRQQIMT